MSPNVKILRSQRLILQGPYLQSLLWLLSVSPMPMNEFHSEFHVYKSNLFVTRVEFLGIIKGHRRRSRCQRAWRSSEIKWTKPNKWWDWLTGLCVEGWRLLIDESVKKTGSEWPYLLWHLYSLTFYLFCLFWNLCDELCDIIICFLLFILNFSKIYLFGDFQAFITSIL